MPEYIAYIQQSTADTPGTTATVHQLEAPNIRAARNTASTFILGDRYTIEEVRVIGVKDIPKVELDN